jgi:hypothetical protein
VWFWLLYAAGIVPLSVAGWANRRTTLTPALLWSLAAWAVWGWAACVPSAERVYAALGLTGCAGVSVLGARRPGAGAWNFVVAGLGLVLILVAAEGAVLLTALLGVVILNYLPTRAWPGALSLATGCGWAVRWLTFGPEDVAINTALILVGLAPWLAWAGVAWRPKNGPAVDRLWRTFRDRFGAIWGLRLREQFNRAAANAGWPLELDWFGVRVVGTVPLTDEQRAAAGAALAALTKRFGSF